MIESSPLDPLDALREGKRVHEYLTLEQLSLLLRYIDASIDMRREDCQVKDEEVVRLKDVILLAVNTGARIGELYALRRRDVDLQES